MSTTSISIDEYLAMERRAETRHEFIDGRIVEMGGGTLEHNAICANVTSLLHVGLKGKPFHVFNSDQKIWIPEKNQMVYPDAVVTAHPAHRQDGTNDVITNPLLVVEVLSDSTEKHDRSDKAEAYRSIVSLQEYVLVDQHRIHVERYVRSNRDWVLSEFVEGGVSRFASVELEFQLLDVYDNLTFD